MYLNAMAPNDTATATATAQTTELPDPPEYREPYADEPEMQERYIGQGLYGIMYAGDYEWDTLKCVREAYGDTDAHSGSDTVDGHRRRSLKFHSEWLTVEEARAAVSVMPDYNRFHPEAVDDALADLPPSTKVVVARESSPALYFWTDKPQTVMNILAQINDDLEYGAGVFAPAGPDELGYQGASDTYPGVCVGEPASEVSDGDVGLVRAWWD